MSCAYKVDNDQTVGVFQTTGWRAEPTLQCSHLCALSHLAAVGEYCRSEADVVLPGWLVLLL